MPNGKPGDHWYTDVTQHLSTFSPDIDALIAEIDAIAADGREYTPWDDPLRQRVVRLVDDVLDEVGCDELARRSDTVGLSYRNLTDSERFELKRKLETLRRTL